jgi:hypothetical protein
MKTFKNIFYLIADMDNLRLAHANAQKGKKHYEEVVRVNKNPEEYLKRLQAMLLERTFKNSKYRTFTIIDKGKDREIYSLPYFPDRILHHAILQVLEPIWKSILIRNTFQSIKGRGVEDGRRKVKKALCSKDAKYCLQMDISKFYPSIDNDILKGIIREKIADNDVLWLLDEIIDSTKGVPIGNYISQYFGNIYLSYFDHYVKEKLKIKHYFRYCDDIILIHQDKDYLSYCFSKIEYYLEKELKLSIKSSYQIYPIRKRRINFLGFMFDNRRAYLRKRIAKSFKRAARKYNSGNVSKARSLVSYHGWAKHSDSWNLWNKYIKDFSTIKNHCK